METNVMENDVTVSEATENGDRELKPIPESIEGRQKMIREDVLSGRAKIWKISHAHKRSVKGLLLERNLIGIHTHTGPVGISPKTQADWFAQDMRKGDYFYLCYSTEQMVLLGRVKDDVVKREFLEEDKKEWFLRKYETVIESINPNRYTGKQKGWSPSQNNTTYSVKKADFGLFDQNILIPYFGISLYDESYEAGADVQMESGEQVTEKSYLKEDFLKDVFLDEGEFERLDKLIKRKKNVILQGAPGVGKTFAAKRLAYALMGEKDDKRVRFVQFHQSYSYEDFIMGYRPTEAGGFVLKEGSFYKFCKKAEAD
ncbi:MAG: AAA family ATPase, partial [Ruminococcus sp.]|nr:AAA family ATPase [Ruminococcus sp.]